MKRMALTLIGLAAFALAGCDEGADSLTNGTRGSTDPNGTAGGEDTTFNHNNDPGAADPAANTNPPVEPAQVRLVGSPEVTSRLHACGKLTVSSIGSILATRGMTGGGQRPNGAQSGMQIYGTYTAATMTAVASAQTQASLGGANYNGRVPEAAFGSASAMAKMFDIFSMASYDVVNANWTGAACGTTKVLGADGKFTKDGISCLIGKPATDEHVAIANDAITKNPTDGAKIAIAALLGAAHTCQ